MEKAYAKLHKNYERITTLSTLDSLVDLTGGLSEYVELQSKNEKKEANTVWATLYTYLQQKFLLRIQSMRLQQLVRLFLATQKHQWNLE